MGINVGRRTEILTLFLIRIIRIYSMKFYSGNSRMTVFSPQNKTHSKSLQRYFVLIELTGKTSASDCFFLVFMFSALL